MGIPLSDAGSLTDEAPAFGGGGIPLSAAGDLTDEPGAEPVAPAIGVIEAGVRGAAQGATLNFSDEAVGFAKALFGTLGDGLDGRANFKQKYTKARDEDRKANEAARNDHPWIYGGAELGGNVATSLIPGLGIAKGATVLKSAAQAAKLGAIAGVGASEKEDAAGIATDAAWSGITSGAATGVMGRLLGNAPKRVAQRLVGDVTDGVPAIMRDKVVGKAGIKGATEANDFNGEVVRIMREKGMKELPRDANSLLRGVESKLNETMAPIDAIFSKAGSGTEGIVVNDVMLSMKQIAKDLESNPGTRPLARAVRAQIDDVAESWITKTQARNANGLPVVSANDVRRFASAVGDNGFFGSPGVPPKAGKEVAQHIWGTLKDLIDKNVDEAAEKLGGAGAAELRQLNSRASTLIKMKQALQYKATREATESTRLKDRVGYGVDIGLAMIDPTSFVAKKTYDFVGKPAMRAGDEKLAQLVMAAKNGSSTAQIVERAITLGLSPLVVQPLINWMRRTESEMSEGSPE
jgi:hypothetical protein